MMPVMKSGKTPSGCSSVSLQHLLSRWYNKHPHFFNSLLIAVLVLSTFGNSLEYVFVWDDLNLIVNNPNIKSSSGVSQLLSQSFLTIGNNTDDPTRRFYRPLISLSYALDYAIWGLNPGGYHLTNLICHAITSILAYFLVLVLSRRRTVALLTAALFLLHPTHVENVCWISGRTDVICGAFYFLSLLTFIRMMGSQKRNPLLLLVTMVAYLVALSCKETAITLPVVALTSYVCLADRMQRPRIMILSEGMFILVTIVYFLLRSYILGEAIAPAAWGTLLERILSIPVIFAKYLLSLLTLIPLDPHHSTAFVKRLTEIRFMIGFAVSVFYAAVCIYLIIHRKRFKLFALFLLWIPLTLAPTFKLGAFGDVLHADRFLYLPSLGFAALIALAWTSPVTIRIFNRSSIAKWTAIAVFAFIVISWRVSDAIYSGIWRDNVTLFSHAASTSPNSAYIAYNLGNGHAERGNYPKAVLAYARAVELSPTYTEAYRNMAISLAELGLHASAQRCYRRALELGDTSPVLFYKLGISYRQQGKIEAAIASFRQSLAAGATVTAYDNLAECLFSIGKLDEAEQNLLSALALGPQPTTYNNLAIVSIERGEYEKALDWLRQVLIINESQGLSPDVESAVYYNLAKSHMATGNRGAAITCAQRVLELAKTQPQSGKREYLNDPWLYELAISQ